MFGISRLFSFYIYSALAQDSGVSYTPLSFRDLKTKLIALIDEARANEQYFYIGVGSESERNQTPIQSLCQREGHKSIPSNSTTCPSPSKHVVDERAGKKDQKLMTVYYSTPYDFWPAVCQIQKQLIEAYKKYPLCLNEQDGKDKCMKYVRGIVYLRIYTKE